jgi:hypothetical protein
MNIILQILRSEVYSEFHEQIYNPLAPPFLRGTGTPESLPYEACPGGILSGGRKETGCRDYMMFLRSVHPELD